MKEIEDYIYNTNNKITINEGNMIHKKKDDYRIDTE
jgi:hypothetical protein